MQARLEKIRFEIAKDIELPTDYPIYLWDTPSSTLRLDVGGMTMLRGEDWLSVSRGKKVAARNRVDAVYVLKCTDTNKTIYHFLHELAHTITRAEKHKDHKGSQRLQPFAQKDDDGYLPLHHPPFFYQQLARILRCAKQRGLWVPPPGFHGFDSRSLERFDSFMI